MTPGRIVTSSDVLGLELAEVVYDPLDREPEHEHDNAHFYLAVSGDCSEIYRKQPRQYCRSTVGFLPAGHTHSVKYSDREFRWFRVNANSEWLMKLDEYIDSQLSPVHTRAGMLPELFWRLYREYRFPDSVSPVVIEALAIEMLGEVSRLGKFTDRSTPRWLVQARDFVEAHFAEQIRLIAIADTVSVHPVHLAREFRRHFNCSIGEYVRKRRVEFARCQLAVTDMSLVEIALAAGFCDQSHLSRTFKRAVGITPTEYRSATRVA